MAGDNPQASQSFRLFLFVLIAGLPVCGLVLSALSFFGKISALWASLPALLVALGVSFEEAGSSVQRRRAEAQYWAQANVYRCRDGRGYELGENWVATRDPGASLMRRPLSSEAGQPGPNVLSAGFPFALLKDSSVEPSTPRPDAYLSKAEELQRHLVSRDCATSSGKGLGEEIARVDLPAFQGPRPR